MSSMNLNAKKDSICLASCTGYEVDDKKTPTVQLRLKCPLETCEKTDHVWYCDKCKNPIDRDAKNYFHCPCGKSKSENYTFRCSSAQHGPEFISFLPEVMNNLLKEIPELNILVIGVSDYSSRWINSFVNLIYHPSLQEAIQGNLIETAPLSFHVVDKNNELQEVTFGASKMEKKADICVNVLSMGTMLTRIISVPGLGESREREKVIQYFRKLLSYLRNFRYLHGVCILPTDTPIFQLCFEELLNHFDYRVMRNVVFGFEHSCIREMLRNFAEAKVYLSNLLSCNRSDIVLDENRMYSIDADCFPFVCAVRQGVQSTYDDTENSKMWESSVKEINRLGSYFMRIQPHILFKTMAFVDAKMNVVKVSKPFADIIENLNLLIVEVLNQAASREAIILNVPTIQIQPLPNLKTVCTNSKCVKFKSESFAVCHENCCIDDVALAMRYSEFRLKDCLALNSGQSLCCEVCNCFWDKHMQISYIKTCERSRRHVKVNGDLVYTRNLQSLIEELEKEQEKIIEIIAKIGRYLSKYSFMSISSKIIQYLQNYIEAEERVHVNNRNYKFIDKLIFARNAYFVADKKLMMNVNEKELDEIEYEKLLHELFILKWSGKSLKEMIDATSNALKSQDGQGEVREEFYDLLKK